MREQFSPESAAYSAPKHPPLLENTARNNHTVLSIPKSPYYLTVDPLGNIVHKSKNWQLETWICQKDVFLTPESSQNLRQEYLPESHRLITRYDYGELSITLTHFVQGFERHPDLGFQQISIKNNNTKSFKGDLVIAIRPYTPSGIGMIESINYLDIASGAVLINKHLEILCEDAADNVISAPFSEGDTAKQIYSWQMIFASQCPDKKASGLLKFNLNLDAQSETAIHIKVPLKKIPATKADAQSIQNVIHAISTLTFNAQTLDIERQSAHTILAGSRLVCTPPAFATAYNVNTQYLFSLLKQDIKDDFTRHFAYYTIIELGMGARIHTLISTQLIHKKNNKNRKLPAITMDLLCTLDYLSHLQNTEESRQHLSKISQWFSRLLKRKLTYITDYDVTLIKNSLVFNLLDSFWTLVCLKHLISALKSVHLTEQSDLFSAQYETLNQQIMSYLSLLKKKTNSAHYPAQTDTPFSEEMLSYFYLSLLGVNLDSVRLNTTLEWVNSHFKRDAGIFTQGVLNTAQTLLYLNATMRLPGTTSTDTLEWFLKQMPETFALPRTLHPKTYQGSIGSGHDLLSTALFLTVTKHMLTTANEDTLILLPYFPKKWLLQADLKLEIHHLQTRFGTVSFTLTKTVNTYTLTLDAIFTKQPLGIKLTFPEKIATLTVDNGREKKAGHYTVSIASAAKSAVFHLENATP